MNSTKFMAWFIVIIMILSVMGYVGDSFFTEDNGSQAEYNQFLFTKVNNQWLLKKETKEYYLQYLPQELENLSSPPTATLTAPKLYFGFQPNEKPFNETLNIDKAINSIAYVFYNQDILFQKACLTEKDCPDIPILNCQSNPGINILSGEKDSYSQEEKCLIITAPNNEELLKLTERLIYKLLGVMD